MQTQNLEKKFDDENLREKKDIKILEKKNYSHFLIQSALASAFLLSCICTNNMRKIHLNIENMNEFAF